MPRPMYQGRETSGQPQHAWSPSSFFLELSLERRDGKARGWGTGRASGSKEFYLKKRGGNNKLGYKASIATG